MFIFGLFFFCIFFNFKLDFLSFFLKKNNHFQRFHLFKQSRTPIRSAGRLFPLDDRDCRSTLLPGLSIDHVTGTLSPLQHPAPVRTFKTQGGVLADEMGLGKTAIGIALLLLHTENRTDRLFSSLQLCTSPRTGGRGLDTRNGGCTFFFFFFFKGRFL